MKFVLKLLAILMMLLGWRDSLAQNVDYRHLSLSLDEVINLAHTQSTDALIAKHNFQSSYWEYRSYKASLLPDVNLNGNIANFNRSISSVQDAETGAINYIENYNLRNSIGLSIDQNIALTGGTISLYSDIERLDQFSNSQNPVLYYSQPISLRYSQPIGGYNDFKWLKKIEPKKYELSRREFVESMEDITIYAVSLFFENIIQQNAVEVARKNYQNTNTLYNIAKQRFELGTITKNDILQLELRLLNDSMAIQTLEIDHSLSKFKLKNYLGLYNLEEFYLESPSSIPDITIEYQSVLGLWEENSSFELNNQILLLQADSEIARQKGTGGIEVGLSATVGFSQAGPTISSAFSDLNDQEVVGITLTVPILDWGQRKGRIQMARSQRQVIDAQITKNRDDQIQDISIMVMRFNAQKRVCSISQNANEIADERYSIVMERFKNGNISVTDANQAQEEQDSANKQFLQDLKNFWVYYFNIRRITLYDYQNQKNIVNAIDESTFN